MYTQPFKGSSYFEEDKPILFTAIIIPLLYWLFEDIHYAA